MIKIKRLEEILLLNGKRPILDASVEVFKKGLVSTNPVNVFVEPFIDMVQNNELASDILNFYYYKGVDVLQPILNKKKKIDVSTINSAYVYLTGLLDNEFVIGYDVTKDLITSIYTKSEDLLKLLFKEGAFENTEKYQKNMKALFGDNSQEYGNKVVTSLEKDSLAMGRLDIVGVIGDEVSLDLIIPNKFRSDYASTFKLYPYSTFPYLALSLKNFVNTMKEKTFTEKGKTVKDVRAITVLQQEPDGNIKTRRVTFNGEDTVKAYRRGTYGSMDEMEEAQEKLKIKIKKTECKWDCLKLQLRGFNLEASLYSIPYTVIKLERLLNILPCKLKDIDTSQYMIDFDSVRRLFRARINNWVLKDFQEFNSVLNTEDCANIPDRIHSIEAWSNELEDSDLYKIMILNRALFEPQINGVKKTIEDGLDDMYRNKPNAAKHLKIFDLDNDYNVRFKQVKDLLAAGVCKINSVSTRTGAPREYLATNSLAVLKASYGENRLNAFESPKRAIKGVMSLIKEGKVASYNAFVNRLHKAEIDGLVEYNLLSENSVADDWINVCNEALHKLEEKEDRDSSKVANNPYIINFRRINADSRSEFYGAVDVRNIESLEFGEQKIRKN